MYIASVLQLELAGLILIISYTPICSFWIFNFKYYDKHPKAPTF